MEQLELIGNSKDKELAELLSIYRQNINSFFTTALKVELDEQQYSLLLEAIRPGARVAVRSARGTGKTFLLAGITLWFLLCFDDVNIRILSPSYGQLTTVFMREVKKLHAKLPPDLRDLVEIFTDRVVSKLNSINFAQCITANADKPESLSGQHADVQVILYDEMSAIDEEVFDITLGSLGTAIGGGHVVGVSNPTRGDGFYADLFDKKPKNWKLLTFTAFKCPRILKSWIEEQKELNGEDSDFYRVNVLGEFPRSDGSVFIPTSLVQDAIERYLEPREYISHPITMGVDVARSLSGDATVFTFKQGYKLLDITSFRTDDTMETVARMRDEFYARKISSIYIDATAVGGPVGDRAREIGLPVVDVIVGSKSSDPAQYYNLRAQLWGQMREWLRNADIPAHDKLKKELGTMQWGYGNNMSILLMSKKQLKSLRIPSPDHADSLSLHFFHEVLNVRRSRGKARRVMNTNCLFA